MNVHDLLDLDIDSHLTISTEVFTLAGKSVIELEDGSRSVWLFADEDLFLALSPDAEEMMLFTLLETAVEKDDEVVVESGKDYEFSYEDRGNIKKSEGESPYDEGVDLEFADYEADDGDVVRIITNTFNGESQSFRGHIVTDEDILRQE